MRLASPTLRLLVIACGVAIASCGDNDATPSPGSPTLEGTLRREERVWIDASRPTPPNRTYPGAPTRTLRVLMWFPPDVSGPLPVLVMAHGFGGLPEKFDAFARTVAAAGYLVVAPAFPLTNEDAPGGHLTGFGDLMHQPADVSFVITQLLAAASTVGDELYGRLATADIAVLGHSFGGATVILLTRDDCCRDARPHASILVSALISGQLSPAGPPTLVIHGTADRTIPYSNGITLYDSIEPPRFLLGLPGAGHSDAVESPLEPAIPARDAAQRATIAFLDAVFRGAVSHLTTTLSALAAEGDIVQADGTL